MVDEKRSSRMPDKQEAINPVESTPAGVSRRGLIKTALAGAGALMLTQTGTSSAKTPLPIKPADPGPAAQVITPQTLTTTPAFTLSVAPGVIIKSILTTGDRASNGYRMSGIPDGLGIVPNGQWFT